MDEVKFLISPNSLYLVRVQTAQLNCRALNAKQTLFFCDSKLIEKSRHKFVTGVDPTTQIPYLEAQIDISREDFVSNSSDIVCYCLATTSLNPDAYLKNNNLIKSESGKIHLAYIKKHFHQMPVPQRIAEGETAQLPCVPPDADPKPDIIWKKNDQEIQPNIDSNLILANDGSLIISAARLSDSGNYSCEATNIANRRISETAQVTVYVNGNWSEWIEWQGSCSQAPSSSFVECAVLVGQIAMTRGSPDAIKRLMPRQRRTRACNNPAPLNEGANCDGLDEEFRLCDWSHWSIWSECNDQCQSVRHRECIAPSPANGGDFCQGQDLQWRNCSHSNSASNQLYNSKTSLNNKNKLSDDLFFNEPNFIVSSHCLFESSKIIQKPLKKDSNLLKSHSNKISLSSNEFEKTGIRKLDVSMMNENDESLLNNINNKAAPPILTQKIWQKQQFKNSEIGLESNNFMNGYSSQIYILASLSCVAFLLCVIALLIAVLLCNRRKRQDEMSPNCKKYQFGNSATTTTLTTTGTSFDFARRIFSNENGEKIYFPIATTTQDDNLRTVLLNEKNQRTLIGSNFAAINCGNAFGTRASTPNTRFYTLSTAKNNENSPFIRHTSSTSGAATLLGADNKKMVIMSSNNARTIKDLDNGYFSNSTRLADSRAALLPGTDYSSSNVSSGDGSTTTTTYKHLNNPNCQNYFVDENKESIQQFLYSPINSEYYVTNQNICESENGGNYATLYDYVISTSSKPINCDNPIIHDDSGNNSSSSEQYPPSSCTAEFLDDDELVIVENNLKFNRNNTIGLVNKPTIELRDFSIKDINCGKFGTLPNNFHNNNKYLQKINYKQLKNTAYNEDNAPTMVAAQVESECTRIELKRSGVALTIGEFAFSEECMVFLSVSDDVNSRPVLQDDETWLSSVVIFGLCNNEINTQSSMLEKPVNTSEINNFISFASTAHMRRPIVISFEHCASLFPKDNWQFVLYGDLSNNNNAIINNNSVENNIKEKNNLVLNNQTKSNINENWEVLCRVGEENLNTRVYVVIEREQCHIMTENFGRFLLAGRAKRSNVAAQKRVHLAAYCTAILTNESDYNITSIRVYCVPETQMSIESVRKQEDDKNGILLSEVENFLMLPQGALCCCLEEIGNGYTLQADSNQYLEISETNHLWCAQNGLHFSLNLRQISTEKSKNKIIDNQNETKTLISGRIVIYQKGNPSERQILAFNLNYAQLLEFNKGNRFIMPSSVSQNNSLNRSNKLEISPIVSNKFQLNYVIKQKLCELLDLPIRLNNSDVSVAGWIALTKKLGFDRYVQYFGAHPGCSPTSLIFDLWEATVCGSERALLDLLQALRILGYTDAVLLLEKYFSSVNIIGTRTFTKHYSSNSSEALSLYRQASNSPYYIPPLSTLPPPPLLNNKLTNLLYNFN